MLYVPAGMVWRRQAKRDRHHFVILRKTAGNLQARRDKQCDRTQKGLVKNHVFALFQPLVSHFAPPYYNHPRWILSTRLRNALAPQPPGVFVIGSCT